MCSTGENRKSISDAAEFMKIDVACTASGASLLVRVVRVPEPMCIDTTVPVSAQAAKNGSQ